MLVRIRARPDALYISHGRTVLATSRDGCIHPGSRDGLYVHETRLIKTLRYSIDGRPPVPNVLSNVEQHSFLGYYIIAAPGVEIERDTGSGMVPPESQQPLELRIHRQVRYGLHERLVLTNHARAATRFTFAVEIEKDCSDMSDPSKPLHIERGIDVRSSRGGTTFQIELAPHESWELELDFIPTFLHHPETSVEPFQTRIEAPGSGLSAQVCATLEQARQDLESLRLPDLDSAADAWTFAAGLPLYIALFGRDTLTASWQAAMLGPAMMRGTLDALAKLQGTREDDWRDEQPGRMLHEAHTGPAAALGLNPRDRNYGSVTTSGLFPFMLAELWHWTGDRDAVRPYVDNALDALAWLDRERLHEGVYTYQTRSKDGVKHQAWKDAPGAIVYGDGREVEPPIATCEEQGFVFIAKLHFAETLWALGERVEAKRLFDEALQLRARFNEAFWMEDEGYYALALDANFEQVRSIASNAGHCIATAIADDAHVVRVASRMFEEDLFSGWGIRTLSSKHPAFNPYSYHLGSIWPVEQGTFAMGFMRYGLHGRAQQLARAQFEAATLFDFHRLPELFSGHSRDEEHPFPALYPNANSPQAWSASTVFLLLQAMLGMYPYAPLHVLIVDPHLPEWLPEITIRDMRVGEATVTIRFRERSWEVLEKAGKLHVVQQPLPWSLTARAGERLWDLMKSVVK
jgi:glycogen debranching enzyme